MGKDHIWAKTIYGIQHSGTGKSDPKDNRIQHSWQENQTQRPYMGKDHIWDSTQWDRKIRPNLCPYMVFACRWSLPIYGLCPGRILGKFPGKPGKFPGKIPGREIPRENPREIPSIISYKCFAGSGFLDDRIQHSWQENQTQIPYMGKDHIWDSTQWDRKIRPKRR